ncbi:MAG: EAL domain-containing protein, partial [Nitrospirota bacterium]|nr:EAL domain-containing protein [Nitrospirota bacterium]
GDEFGVLLENCSLVQAQEIAEKIKDVVQEFRFAWEGKMFKVGASVGVVGISEHCPSVAEILSDADAACYAAKDAGRNCVKVHNPTDDALSHQRREMQWATHIHQVLDDNRFKLFLQQICPLNGGLTCHWEILLRLEDEKGRLILPGAFIPAAERYGLMKNIDRWVLRSVLRQIYEHTRLTSRTFPMIAVNLSAASLSDETFLYFVREQFDEWEIDASRICFEITETAAITNFTRARSFILEMKLIGSQFALDDFGSGMSSFGYLKSLPVDFLKIDGAFVSGIVQNTVDHAMVDSINKIGHLMGIQTIAESAEDKEIVDKLWHMGVDFAQGFAIHRPIALESFFESLSPS